MCGNEWQADSVSIYLCVFVQVSRDNFPIIPEQQWQLWVWSLALSVTQCIVSVCCMTQMCSEATWYVFEAKAESCCVGAVRRRVVYKDRVEEGWKGGGRYKKTAKAQKLYLSLLDWLIIELPRSCMQQSVLREKFTKYFLLNPFLCFLRQTRGEIASHVCVSVCVWAADWITEASGEWVYSFSLTKNNNKRNAEGEKGGSAPPCSRVKEQLVDTDRSPRPGNNLWKCFMDLRGWYSWKKDSLESLRAIKYMHSLQSPLSFLFCIQNLIIMSFVW